MILDNYYVDATAIPIWLIVFNWVLVVLFVVLGLLFLVGGLIFLITKDPEVKMFDRVGMTVAGVFLLLFATLFFYLNTSTPRDYEEGRADIVNQLEEQGYSEIDLDGTTFYAKKDGELVECIMADTGNEVNWKVFCE